MGLKRRLRQVIELTVFVSALPVLLLGCGGGSTNSDPYSGMMSGQYWTDLTGNGIKKLYPGSLATASSVEYPAGALTDTAAFVAGGGRYAMTRVIDVMSGVAWTARPENSYYLASGGWQIVPSIFSITALNATTLRTAEVAYSTATITVSTVNLSGTMVTASSAVPAIDQWGHASSVSPASINYPADSYAYTLASTVTTRASEHWVYAQPYNEVTTYTSSSYPVAAATFTDAAFKLHNIISDPICIAGLAFVYSNAGDTYDVYGLTLNGGVPSGTAPNCVNATIPVGPPSIGTYDLTFSTILGTTVATFSSPTGGWFPTHNSHGSYVVGAPILGGKVYHGDIFPAGTTTNTSYWLNKTAMDAALGAWGAPAF